MDAPTVSPLLPQFTAQQNAPVDAPGSAAATADFQSFLTLLTSQLRHQDPLQPLDSTQFVAQLASFSTVEQLVGTNTRLDSLTERAGSADLASFAGWIGRQASATDGRFIAQGGPESFQTPPLAGAIRIEAIVVRPDGTEVDRFDTVPDATSRTEWAGATATGIPVGSELRIELVYHGTNAVLDRRPAGIFREITGLRGTSNGPVLDLAGGGSLSPGDVAELRM